MFGSHRRLLSVSKLSARILRIFFGYATFFGFICFGIEGTRTDGCLVAQNRYWYKWFCILTRIILCVVHGYLNMEYIFSLKNSHLAILSCIRLIACVICAFFILAMHIWFGQRVLRVVNSFLRLFRKVNALPGCQDVGFGGKRELSLLIFKGLCLLNDIICKLYEIFSNLGIKMSFGLLCDMYAFFNACMIGHMLFVGYLSVGALYAQVNRYVQHELSRQLRALERPHGCLPSRRRQLRAVDCRLDECLASYDEIQRASTSFNRLTEIPLCIILLFCFFNLTLVSIFIMLKNFSEVYLWFLLIRWFIDVVLLILAIHGARSSSRVVRRLSLENFYVIERNDWDIKLEMFLSRLNFYEFRVCPLGLFEISNELILLFVSGLVTCLTFIIQSYGMQLNQN